MGIEIVLQQGDPFSVLEMRVRQSLERVSVINRSAAIGDFDMAPSSRVNIMNRLAMPCRLFSLSPRSSCPGFIGIGGRVSASSRFGALSRQTSRQCSSSGQVDGQNILHRRYKCTACLRRDAPLLLELRLELVF